MTYGERVKLIRDKLFLSQEALAKELGVNITTVNRWENGKTQPNYKAKKALHEFCQNHNITIK